MCKQTDIESVIPGAVQAASGFCLSSVREALAAADPVVAVLGNVASGKTEFVVRKTAALLEQGLTRICVVVSTPDAGRALAGRLNAFGVDGQSVRITTPFEEALRILEDPEFGKVTGRRPYILTDAEAQLLFRDMQDKTGLGAKTGPAIMRVLACRSLMGVDAPAQVDEDQQHLHDLLTDELKLSGCVLRSETSALAAEYLLNNQDSPLHGSYEALLIDDAQNLSVVTLAFLLQLTSGYRAIAGNPRQMLDCFDPFATSQGIARLAQLCGPIRQCALEDGLGVPSSSKCASILGAPILSIQWNTLEQECAGAVELVKRIVSADDSIDKSAIYLAVPNDFWGDRLARLLEAASIRATRIGCVGPLGRRVRAGGDDAVLEPYARLSLAANPGSPAAWRLWCAVDAPDAPADVWVQLGLYAQKEGLGLLEALTQLPANGDAFPGSAQLVQAYARGEAAIQRLTARHGHGLVRAIAGLGNDAFERLCEPMDGAENARQLYQRVRLAVMAPSFSPATDQVLIGPYEQLQGLNPAYVLALGMVDGVVPACSSADRQSDADPNRRKRAQREMARTRQVLIGVAGKPTASLVLMSSKMAQHDQAVQLHLDVQRLKTAKGQTWAVLAPSPYIDEAGSLIPGVVSGEQFLASMPR